MSKKAKQKMKDKKAIGKSKEVSVKKKDVIDELAKLAGKNRTLKTKQKGLAKHWKALRQQYMTLAVQYHGMEKQATKLRKRISQLQLDSEDIKGHLATEVKNSTQVPGRSGSPETHQGADQEQLSKLAQQMQRQDSLVDDVGERVRILEQVSSQGEHLREQTENLQAGKTRLESSMGKLIAEVDGLKSGNKGLGAGIESLSNRLDETAERMQEESEQDQVMKTWIENLKQADADLSQGMDQQQERIQTFSGRVARLDHATERIVNASRSLQEQVGNLRQGLTTVEKRLLDRGVELEENIHRLDSEQQHQAVRQRSLIGTLFFAGILLLILGGVGYWLKFTPMEHRTIAATRQIEQISDQMEQHDRRLLVQERFLTPQERTEADQKAMTAEWNARFERLSQTQDTMSARLSTLTEKQDEIIGDLIDFEGEWEEIDDRLDKTQNQLAETVTEQRERRTAERQHTEKLGSIDKLLQKNRVQTKVASSPTPAASVRDTGYIKGLNPGHYTIQIFAAYNEDVLSRVAARDDLQEVMAVYKGEFNQKDWYVLLYGIFSSVGQARSAVQDLPEDVRIYGPWVRNVSTIQGLLAEQ